MTDATDERIASIERGLDALFATEVASEILEAVDFEAILAEQPAEDPVDVERLAEALGRRQLLKFFVELVTGHWRFLARVAKTEP